MADNIDLAKRRVIMQRSMKLGHCICDPRRSCPCDVFRDDGICPCAGEKPRATPAADVRLMDLVHNAGCASKIPPAELEAILARLPAVDDPSVISGLAAGDDAGVYRLASGDCLVQTVDVMTPCSDDAATFGRICAANCLSDIYAMGGVPRTALSILAFPSDRLDGQLMYEMMKGAMEVLADAGVALIGGHSIKEETEIKLGFAVTGTIDPARAVAHDRLAVGDVLVLTKPLGSGVLGFARQIDRCEPADAAGAQQWMATLNKSAAEAMLAAGATGCTDVTGFGLLGHLIRQVRYSHVTAELWADALPAMPGAIKALRDGIIPGAIERNREYLAGDLEVAADVEDSAVHLALDAQTSGGLLISTPADRHEALLKELSARACQAWTIGQVTAESDGRIAIVPGRGASRDVPVPAASAAAVVRDAGILPAGAAGVPPASSSVSSPASSVFVPLKQQNNRGQDALGTRSPYGHGTGECCQSPTSAAPAAAGAAATTDGTAAYSVQAFNSLMRVTAADGAVPARTKVLIDFALVVMSRCAPCFANFYRKAIDMGITQAELDEAAWCAISMGGAPVRMFYAESLASTGERPRGCCS